MITETYHERNLARQMKQEEATTEFINYFIEMGDDLPTAQDKVSQVSSESALWLYPYILGNTQPLIDSINASALVFMDENAKTFIIEKLS
jgi:hypothetical protein